jgi:hypothetical protein|tara:strand:- start:1268 stop:1489 length:222 start_codon:yes stop_codon:yes gene_type:complete
MSNQRPGNYQSKAMFNDNGSMLRQAIKFATEAEVMLMENGENDASFYFGQLREWLVENPTKAFNEKTSKILGC